jgi:diguanylate cyclase (GGDEF)-like protein/PAS domain S-box-containing protein
MTRAALSQGAVKVPFLRTISYLAIFIAVNGFIWRGIHTRHENRMQAELESFTQMEMAIVHSAARATESWLEALTDPASPSRTNQVEQEVLQRFIKPIQLLKNGDAWVFRNGISVFDGSSDFPEMYRGKTIRQIFMVQQAEGAQHYERLVSGVMQGNQDSDWFIWLPEKGPEYAAWTSIKIGTDIWTIGLSTPRSEILAASHVKEEFHRSISEGLMQSFLTLALLILIFHSHYIGAVNIRRLTNEIKDRTEVEKALRNSENRYRRLFSDSKAIQLIINPEDGRILDANTAASLYYGHGIDILREMSLTDINALNSHSVLEEITDAKSESRTHYLFKHRMAGGEIRDVEMYVTPTRHEGSHLLYAIIHDVTERRRMEQQIKHMGNHDPLTNLPNRNLLLDRLEMALSQAKRSNNLIAVLFLDLDGFKPINDQFGHLAGDHLLQEVARRLQACTREADTVSRFGGDEFVVVLTGMGNEKFVVRIAQKIKNAITKSVDIAGRRVRISSSIGIALYPSDSTQPEDLLLTADKAMYEAKRAGKNQFKFSAQLSRLKD